MKKIFMTFIGLVGVMPALVIGQTQQSLSGFQDIAWGSSIQAVKTKFPQIKPYDACKGAKANEQAMRDFYNKRDTACTTYSIEKYNIDGINFNLTFSFTTANGLKDVAIDKHQEGSPSISLPECQSAYSKLSNLLKNKYGAGTAVPADADFLGFKALGFQSHDAQIWVLGQTQLYLSNSWNHKDNQNYCWVNLNYTPSKLAASSKL